MITYSRTKHKASRFGSSKILHNVHLGSKGPGLKNLGKTYFGRNSIIKGLQASQKFSKFLLAWN